MEYKSSKSQLAKHDLVHNILCRVQWAAGDELLPGHQLLGLGLSTSALVVLAAEVPSSPLTSDEFPIVHP